jgi:hypothetical protein
MLAASLENNASILTEFFLPSVCFLLNGIGQKFETTFMTFIPQNVYEMRI